MVSKFFGVVLLAAAGVCATSMAGDDAQPKDKSRASAANDKSPVENKSPIEIGPDRASAVFAGGCFWCVESDFEKAPGVVNIISGYSGGRSKNPTYKNYAGGGHREVIFVVYDPTKVTYAGLVEYLLKHIDPTDRNGSFIDKGVQYTSAIYYATPEEKAEAQRVAKAIDEMKVLRGKVNVPILPRQAFWPAEEYHQDYHNNNMVKYGNYRASCGRDAFVQKLWGSAAKELTIPGAFPDEAQIEKAKQDTEGEVQAKNDLVKKNLAKKDKAADKGPYKEAAAWMKFEKPTDRELRKKLSAIQFDVTQKSGTEIAFRNPFWNHHEEGLYVDVVSGEPLFASVDKFESGTGWPSFVKPVDPRFIVAREDHTEVPVRTEIRSRIGDSHLGHVFDDGPQNRGGLRYCINSASLRFIPKRKMAAEGYGDYLQMFEDSTASKK